MGIDGRCRAMALASWPERVTHVINFASNASAARHAARATASNSTSWRGTTFADF
jgi:hypothetical protein